MDRLTPRTVMALALLLTCYLPAQEPTPFPPTGGPLPIPVAVNAKMVVYAGVLERRQTYLSFWDGKVAARIAIEYGQPMWKKKYDQLLNKLPLGRYRLGRDDWARLRTNVPVNLSGKIYTAGIYCLCLERRAGGWSLVLLDQTTVKKRNLVPFASAKTGKLGSVCPLIESTVSEVANKLNVTLTPKPKQGPRSLNY